MTTHNPNNNTLTLKTIGAVILSIAGILGSVKLKILGFIGEPSLLSLIAVFCLVGLFVGFSHRIKDFSLAKLSVQLYELKSIQNDVRAREEHIRTIALILGEITLFNSVTSGIMFSREIRETRRVWFELKVKELMLLISALPEERLNVFKFLNQFKDIYTKGHFDEARQNIGWEKFWSIASEDIDKITAQQVNDDRK